MSAYSKKVNAILKKIKKGDSSQIDCLIDLTANHLRVVAIVNLHDASFCDDVLTETYTSVMSHIKTFDSRKDGYNWLCKITQNWARKYNIQSREFDTSDEWHIAENDRCEVDLDAVCERMDLQIAAENLDRESKIILYRRFYLDETLQEIGSGLGISKVAVHKKLTKILKKMKIFLENG